ncbi:MAG: response regulator transcription factor [Candidatus Kuenenia stuttgartiensis]|nr:response regulator transcription factor [Candidatus Kuenenia stuttgartiensis]
MSIFDNIVRNRANPGVIVFSVELILHYINQEAINIISNCHNSDGVKPQLHIPPIIYDYCLKILRDHGIKINPSQYNAHFYPLTCLKSPDNNTYLLKSMAEDYHIRGFLIEKQGNSKNYTHIFILLEKVIESHGIDISLAARRYKLTKREEEVIELIYGGFANKDIAKKMFISVHTVKDHIKNLMRKMDVSSRGEVVAKLREFA